VGLRRYGRRSVQTTNEDKVLFPQAGITKGDLIDYYERASDLILPHLAGRPLVLRRFPDGVEKDGFYQKRAGADLPEWVSTVEVDLRSSDGRQRLVVCDRKATLGYLAQLACVELHPWLSREDRIDRPDRLVVDLDPAGDDFDAARRAALAARELLEGDLGLPAFAMLTGSRGVHVVVPLLRGDAFDAVRAFARRAMEVLASRRPRELTTEHRKRRRRGRVYLDVARNAYAQTAVAPWSVRARPEASVAVPVSFEDLERRALGPRDFTVATVFRKIARRDDPWKGMRRRARSLAPARERLDRLEGS
jgi:bifunctional non-homologous end joining protein LigD